MSPPLRIRLRLRRPGGWSRRGRLVFLLVFALAVSLGARSVFGDKGLLEWWRLRAEADRLQREVVDLQAQVAAEREAIRDLREGDLAVERIAREELGMARKGEVTYLLPPPQKTAQVDSDEQDAQP